MAGTKIGGQRAAATNKLIHGQDFYVRIGRRGGQNGNTGGFYADRQRASQAGRKGGLVRGEQYKTRLFKTDNTEFGEGFDQPTWKDKIVNKLGGK